MIILLSVYGGMSRLVKATLELVQTNPGFKKALKSELAGPVNDPNAYKTVWYWNTEKGRWSHIGRPGGSLPAKLKRLREQGYVAYIGDILLNPTAVKPPSAAEFAKARARKKKLDRGF